MNCEIKLLDASLLADEKKLEELSYWFSVLNRPNGWHYDLDHIWILNELEKAGLKPGDTILDAGAGQGILQYLLASRGYNVISLDFSPRSIPVRTSGIFSVIGDGEAMIDYQHPYMQLISYGMVGKRGLIKSINTRKIKKIPSYLIRQIHSYILWAKERYFVDHKNYGKITYLRAPFHEVPLDSSSVDAIVSVSAIEHADISLFQQNIDSLAMLLKPSASMLITTSATKHLDNLYNETVSGWCFSEGWLRALFPNCQVEFDFDLSERSMLTSRRFINRIDPYYFQAGQLFASCNISELPYYPFSIRITKI